MDAKDRQSDLIGLVLGSATAVHRALGPGLFESIYERALCTELEDVHVKQVLSYLRLAGLTTGLLLNFNRPLMKQGIRKAPLFVDPPCAP